MKKSDSIFIGTSGWNYKHWKKKFYPEDISQKDWLRFYSEKFNTVEINSSFYHLPKKKTFENWKNSVPKNFLFSVKASRYITHMKKLKDSEEGVNNFLESAKTLNNKFGCSLFQLPPSLKLDIIKLNSFLKILPDNFKYTFEFRDPSWWNNDVFELLIKYNAAFCIYELGKTISPKEITADFIYIRLHGPGKKYKGDYNKQTLSGWAGAFNSWIKKVKEIYCYFDNDENGFAPKNALELKKMIEG